MTEPTLKQRLLGTGVEVGTGVGTDLLTAGLLNPASIASSKGLSILAYAGINGFQGAYTNYLVQKNLYGADNVNWGEILSSGFLSAIPFMNLKAGKNVTNIIGDANTVRRGIAGGVGLGLAGEQLRVGIDEQRLLNPTEALLSAGIGGTLGGGITQLSKLKKKPNVVPQFDSTGATDDLMRQQAGLKMRLLKSIDPEDSLQPRKGGFSDDAEREIAKIQKELRVEKGDQLGLFTNEGDAFLYEKYKAQNKVIGTPLPKRQQAGRALRPTDFDDIIAEYPEITPDLIFAYIESTKAGRYGKGVKNPTTKRFKRSNRGLEGTLKFLNKKAAPDPNFDLSEIAAELSAEFNKTITPKTLSNIIDENVRQGTFTFKTQGMKKPIVIKSIDDLRKAYMGRLARYGNIPAFERGHVFAADNIIKDKKIKSLTDFKNNLEPEIARSIYAQLDDEALDELIKANVNNNFEDIESLYKSILAGNRKRKNLNDPDKVIAALYGRDYGLRESFLNFVFPNRSLNRLIPPDLKAAFTDLYKKELAMRLLDYKGLTIGPAALDKIKLDVAQDVLKSFPDVDTRFVLEQMTLASDKGYLRDMVDEFTGEAK